MSLFSDFTTYANTGTESEQFLIDYYLKPAIDLASKYCINTKQTTVNLQRNVTSYDLTDPNIASPAVNEAGIQDIDLEWDNVEDYFIYKVDYYIEDLTTLKFVSNEIDVVGEWQITYNAFFTKPVLAVGATPYVESDLYSRLYPAVVKYAGGLYNLSKLQNTSLDINGDGNIIEKSESDMKIRYSQIDLKSKEIRLQMEEAENEMKIKGGASSKFRFSSVQIF